MARLGHLAKGLAALVILAGLVAGVPWALCHFVGWPLPHAAPTWTQIRHGLDRHGIGDRTLLDALAVVVWATWAVLVASLAAEIPAAVRGRTPRGLPVAGLLQPVTGRLVAAVIVAVLSLTPRGAHPAATWAPRALSPTARPAPVTAVLVADPHRSTIPVALLTDSPTSRFGLAAPRSPGATTSATETYVVARGDTLWGIAQRQLGDPLRWSQIFQLNEGRPQPGGHTLTDPHWIDPGWTLILPAAASTASAPPETVAPPSPSASPATAPVAAPTTSAPPSTASPTTRDRVPAVRPSTADHRAGPSDRGAVAVRLPSGSVVAGSFAAGVLAAVSLGRLRRRHAYRYHPPEPGRNLVAEPLRPMLRHLAHVVASANGDGREDIGTTIPLPAPSVVFDDPDARQHPGRLDLGTRGADTVTVEIIDLSGVAVCGLAADDIARAVLAGLLVRAGPGAAEAFLTTSVADRLLPGLGPDPAIRHRDTDAEVARVVEAETIARTRRLAAAETSDAAAYRTEHQDPLPLLLVVLDAVPDDTAARWAALVTGTARLGIAVIFVGDTPAATGRLVTDATRTVTDAPAAFDRHLAGACLFGLGADEAVDLLGAVIDSRAPEPASDPNADDGNGEGPVPATYRAGRDDIDEPTPGDCPAGEQWLRPSAGGDLVGSTRPLLVCLFGPYRIAVHGHAVTGGLRARARLLLAWYLLHPEGATADEAIDALWPDTPPDGVHRQFWRALGDLRARLRDRTGDPLDVLAKTGDHYQPATSEIACDLWDFQDALADAARAGDDTDTVCRALRQAVDCYGGELFHGSDFPWVEAVRENLHRRALDAHLRLAELENAAGRPEVAVGVLERAVNLEGVAEEPYRRLMALHATTGGLDAVTATWRALQARLGDLDLDVEPATARLYRTLVAEPAGASDPGPVRLPT